MFPLRINPLISPEQAETQKQTTPHPFFGSRNDFNPETDDPDDPNRWMRAVKPIGVYGGMQGLASIGEGIHNAAVWQNHSRAMQEQRASSRAAGDAMQKFVAGGGIASGPGALADLMRNPKLRDQAWNMWVQQNDPNRKLEQERIRAQIAHQQSADQRATEAHQQNMLERTPSYTYEKRKQELAALGIDPASEQGKRFVFTGSLEPAKPEVKVLKDGERPYVVDPQNPASPKFIDIPGGMAPKLSTDDHKAIRESEDNALKYDAGLRRLQRAHELAPETYTGWTAGIRGTIANNTPTIGEDGLMFSDKAGAATREYSDLMSAEAIKAMGDSLKGATTEKEMQQFLTIIGDISKPVKVRQNAIQEMIKLTEAQKQLSMRRAADVRSGEYYKPGYKPPELRGGTYGSAPAPAGPQGQRLSADDAKKLPPGTRFIGIDGIEREVR